MGKELGHLAAGLDFLFMQGYSLGKGLQRPFKSEFFIQTEKNNAIKIKFRRFEQKSKTPYQKL